MNKVLLIVDMQQGFMTKENYKKLAIKINDFLKCNSYEKVVLTKFINVKNSLYVSKLNWNDLQDEKSQEFAINIPKNAIILKKYGYGLNIDDLQLFKNLNIDSIDICGLQTDACVYAIAFQMFDIGIYPNILINYCATTPSREENAKELIIHQFGKVDERIFTN